MEVYAAMAESLDHQVGRLIAYLKSTGEYDNTVFVFLSDNGPEGSDYKEADLWLMFNYSRDLERLGGKGAYVVPGPSWASASASPLNTFKFYSGEGGIRSPLIISGVAGTARNQIHDGLTHVTDILPTLLDVARVTRPGTSFQGQPIEPPTGRSLVPVLADPALRVRSADEPLGYELSGNKALFKGDLKIALNNPPMGDGQWHLYDLRADPGETSDLQKQRPQEFAAMQAAYAVWAKPTALCTCPMATTP
ncbi:MAG: sulfatase-like hydrolase/transferase [Comamonadaceae bacterium]|nr:sulfatase-like hydrolase/transferase [Comamonadaceae bacterium]